MIRIVVKPTRRLLSGRKQWRARAFAPNGKNLSLQEGYANVGDIIGAIRLLREDPIVLEIHYATGIETELIQ